MTCDVNRQILELEMEINVLADADEWADAQAALSELRAWREELLHHENSGGEP
jgi:hypothetical protein